MSHHLRIEHHYTPLSAVRMHYVTAGSGDPVVLLHGWPQSWYEWREVIAYLAPNYRVIAPDLRGLGDSSRPADGYDKRTVAADVWELLSDKLGLADFFLAGHDWGGPVAFSLSAAHPDSVSRLAIIDVAIPGDGSANISQGGRRWHHAFHQTRELPEALIIGREEIYLRWFYENYGARTDAVSEDAIAEYLRTYTDRDALHAGFEYYRNIPTDIAHNEAILRQGKLTMPVLALGGGEAWGRGEEVLKSCQRIAHNARGGVIDNAGHWIPEEQPAILAAALQRFFAT